jgi:serine/threonine protein kinase
MQEKETKKMFAMKVMSKIQMLKKGAKTIEGGLREREILSELNHPMIVNLWGSIQDEHHLFLVPLSFHSKKIKKISSHSCLHSDLGYDDWRRIKFLFEITSRWV